jgi:hypothetical protein
MNPLQSSFHTLTPATLIIIALITLFPAISIAQFYDNALRPKLEWSELQTPHFRIIYHDGLESIAQRAAVILEEQYPIQKAIYGGSLSNFPVVINGYNDLTNGYVTTLHFRMEIEAPPLAGSILNPVGADRLESLLTHELIHALQFSVKGGIGFTRLMYWFSPDIARSNHGLTPPGFREGIAVQAESNLLSGEAGRGNFAPFTNPFYANLSTSTPWNLSQQLTPSPISRPVDRYYIGGYHFTEWLSQNHDSTLIRSTLHRFAAFPFIGYAPYLWHSTQKSMPQLYREFTEDAREHLTQLQNGTQELPLVIHRNPYGKGEISSAPKWINNETLIYYGSWYNKPSGFYSFNISTGKSTNFLATRIDESFQFDIDLKSNHLVYSRYRPHPTQTDRFTTDLFNVDTETKEISELTNWERVRAPKILNDSTLIALQTIESNHLPVTVHRYHGKVIPWKLSSPDPSSDQITITELAISHNKTQIGVVAILNAQAGLWIIPVQDQLSLDLSKHPDVHLPHTTLLNPNWTPDATLWFTTDLTGIQQIYQYYPSTRELIQRTNHPWNLTWPSVSPDQESLATIAQYGNERILATISISELDSIPIPIHILHTTTSAAHTTPNPTITPTPHQSGLSWLKPRTVLPWTEIMNSGGDLAHGISLHSSDVLRRHTYQADFLYGNKTLFYDIQYRYSGHYPITQIRASQLPYNPGNPTSRDQIQFYGMEREYGLGLNFRRQYDHKNTLNSLLFQPEIVYRTSRVQIIDSEIPENNQTSEWIGSNRLRLFSSFNYRLRSNIRSVDPVSGLILFAQGDQDLFMIQTERKPFSGLRAGVFTYIQPLSLYNHTIRLGIQSVWQNRRGYNTLNLLHEGFSDQVSITKDFFSASIRYSIPIGHPDTGGILIPAFLERYYLTWFTESVSDYTLSTIHHVIGVGLRARIRIFYNVTLDIGLGIAIQPEKPGSETIVLNF